MATLPGMASITPNKRDPNRKVGAGEERDSPPSKKLTNATVEPAAASGAAPQQFWQIKEDAASGDAIVRAASDVDVTAAPGVKWKPSPDDFSQWRVAVRGGAVFPADCLAAMEEAHDELVRPGGNPAVVAVSATLTCSLKQPDLASFGSAQSWCDRRDFRMAQSIDRTVVSDGDHMARDNGLPTATKGTLDASCEFVFKGSTDWAAPRHTALPTASLGIPSGASSSLPPAPANSHNIPSINMWPFQTRHRFESYGPPADMVAIGNSLGNLGMKLLLSHLSILDCGGNSVAQLALRTVIECGGAYFPFGTDLYNLFGSPGGAVTATLSSAADSGSGLYFAKINERVVLIVAGPQPGIYYGTGALGEGSWQATYNTHWCQLNMVRAAMKQPPLGHADNPLWRHLTVDAAERNLTLRIKISQTQGCVYISPQQANSALYGVMYREAEEAASAPGATEKVIEAFKVMREKHVKGGVEAGVKYHDAEQAASAPGATEEVKEAFEVMREKKAAGGEETGVKYRDAEKAASAPGATEEAKGTFSAMRDKKVAARKLPGFHMCSAGTECRSYNSHTKEADTGPAGSTHRYIDKSGGSKNQHKVCGHRTVCKSCKVEEMDNDGCTCVHQTEQTGKLRHPKAAK